MYASKQHRGVVIFLNPKPHSYAALMPIKNNIIKKEHQENTH